MNNLTEIEKALAERRLYLHMLNGNYWLARRNGKTQTWKTRPGHFRIPVKAGLKSCMSITHDTPSDAFMIKGE